MPGMRKIDTHYPQKSFIWKEKGECHHKFTQMNGYWKAYELLTWTVKYWRIYSILFPISLVHISLYPGWDFFNRRLRNPLHTIIIYDKNHTIGGVEEY